MVYKTKQKNKIIDIIKKEKQFTVKNIYDKLNHEVGLTTIYRLIDKLVDEKIINKYIGNDNITYYEYLEICNKSNHFYLKCLNCSKLIHIDCDCIKELENHIYNIHKFKVNNDFIIIKGLCNDCGERIC